MDNDNDINLTLLNNDVISQPNNYKLFFVVVRFNRQIVFTKQIFYIELKG